MNSYSTLKYNTKIIIIIIQISYDLCMIKCTTLLSPNRALLSTPNPVQNKISELPKQCKATEFPRRTCESSYKEMLYYTSQVLHSSLYSKVWIARPVVYFPALFHFALTPSNEVKKNAIHILQNGP